MNTFPIAKHTELFNKLSYKDTYINNSWPIVPRSLIKLINDFVEHKLLYGSYAERQFYSEMTNSGSSINLVAEATAPKALVAEATAPKALVATMVNRMHSKRPLMFIGGSDKYLLRKLHPERTEGSMAPLGLNKWEDIGTDKEKEPLTLNNYMSYDELELSAFFGLSIYTPFLNNGSRYNSGIVDNKAFGAEETNCEQDGIYIGQVGARFERPRKMEWKYMIVDKNQNTKENGYGPFDTGAAGAAGVAGPKQLYLKMWAEFYQVDYFRLFDEVDAEFKSGNAHSRYVVLSDNCYLDTVIYKKRVEILARVFLKEANNRAGKIGKKAFCHVVGLGLGAWMIDDCQTKLTVDTYMDILRAESFSNISDVYFSWFSDSSESPESSESLVNGVTVTFGKRNPSDKLNDPNKLLVAMWPWDSNSYIGNEYWQHQLRTSGDPAAAASSFIAYIGDPELCKFSTARVW